ncbi:Nop52-domain-containing protein [Clavulina sp. PMI_390]|nr:Nop52-domain-containing protein [Clavulina sp. PMI_390]
MAKLWKGIFYCFWMSDKPLVQQALATDLANILLSIPNLDAALGFLKGFWVALVREWAGIDRLRLDKYHMLIRRYMNASFRLLIRNGWDPEACEKHNQILGGEGGPLSPIDNKAPSGLQYHVADIYLPELEKALASFPDSNSPVPISIILQPFIQLATLTPSNITFKRIQTSVFDSLLSSLSDASSAPPIPPPSSEPSRKRQKTASTKGSSSAGSTISPDAALPDIPLAHIVTRSSISTSSEEAKKTGSIATPKEVASAVISTLFREASQEGTRDANRRRLYAICKAARDEDD